MSIGLFAFLFYSIDFFAFLAEVQKLNGIFFILVVFITAVAWFSNAIRWHILLHIFTISIPSYRLFLYTLTGLFYSIVLPGGIIAGDVMRTLRISGDFEILKKDKKRLFLSVFLDRVLGFLTLLLVVSFYFIVGHPANLYLGTHSTLNFVIAMGVILITVFIFSGILDFIIYFFIKLPFSHVQIFFRFLLSSLRPLRMHPIVSLTSLLFSLMGILLTTFAVYLISEELKLEVPYTTIVFFYSLAIISGLIPITVAGIGLREGSFVYLLIQSGVDPASALALSVLSFFIIFTLSIVGGVIELHHHFLKPQALSKNVQ